MAPRNIRRIGLTAALVAVGCTGTINTDPPVVAPTAPTPERRDAGPAASSPPPAATVCAPGLSETRLRELTPAQYTRTAQALFGTISRPGDAVDQGQAKDGTAPLSESHVEALHEAARLLADEAVADPTKLHPCIPAKISDPACIRQFVQDFGARAFRRELSDEEVTRYADFFQAQTAAHDTKTGLKLLLRVILGSPDFVFRTELGAPGAKQGDAVALTQFERASALSYFLTDGPPDATLFAAARAGALMTAADVRAQATRLLSSADNAAGLRRFFRERFRTGEVLGAQKNQTAFPAWSDSVPADMDREADLFVQSVLWGGDGTLTSLYSSPWSFVNARLAALYGVAAAKDATNERFDKVQLSGPRAGLLTTGAVMARLARLDQTAPVSRGLFVRQTVLCQTVPPPPPDVNAVPPPPDGVHTERERLAHHREDQRCAGCHEQLDPLGLAFETFDAVGAPRTTESGLRIDPSGVFTGASPEGAAFSDAAGLGRLLGAAPEARACLASRLFGQAQALGTIPADRRCVVDRLSAAFAASGGDIKALAAAVAADDTFFTRRVSP